MDPKLEWRRISALIDGLSSSCIAAKTFAGTSPSLGSSASYLFDTARGIAFRIRGFADSNAAFLSPEVMARLSQIQLVEHLTPPNRSVEHLASQLYEAVIILQSISGDIEYLLSDQQGDIRSRAERALAHLQWSIASSDAVRSEWISAFKRGEPACERLGASHLLLHGIFAFKAHSENARTDLVFREPLDEQSTAFADGLVLTEWKRVLGSSELRQKTEQARHQSDQYAGGILGGRELHNVRYVIVVSMPQMKMPNDVQRSGYVYRHVNVAVEPVAPSKIGSFLGRG